VSLGRTLRALPTLLRIGVAETIAYRGEFLVWILTTTIPLVMLGLWSSVASEAPFREYGQDDFVAYYLATLIVRNLAGTWVAWQISEEIRLGSMAMRLLRPIHPFVAFASSHVAAIPFRSLVVMPVAAVLLLSSGENAVTREPTQLALLAPSLVLAWLISFCILFAIGVLSFWLTKMMGVLNLYFGLFTLLSGYLMPLPLLPPYVRGVAEWLPFRFMQSVPVELITRPMSSCEAGVLVLGQLAWATGLLALSLFVWNRGVKRFESVGG
jgi:ABC-2 type transport system permease protein